MRGPRGVLSSVRSQLSSHHLCLTLQGDVGEKGPEGAPGKDGARVSGTGTRQERGGQQGMLVVALSSSVSPP